VAPEKIQRHGEDFRSDMYSLGGTLYHALTGHVPFEAETVEQVVVGHVQTPLSPPHGVSRKISQSTSDALVKAMAKHPEHRFASYDEMYLALTAAKSYFLVDQQKMEEKSHRSWWRR